MLTVKNKTVFYASKGRPFSDFFLNFCVSAQECNSLNAFTMWKK